MDVTPELAISAFSLIAALLSAMWAYKSNVLAKEALAISHAAHDQQQGAVDCYLAVLRSRSIRQKGRQLYASLTYTNKSHLEDTLVRIELVVHYTNEGVRSNTVIGTIIPDGAPAHFKNCTFSEAPQRIPARGAVSIWVCFQMPSLLDSRRIEKYTFEGVLASGAMTAVSSSFVPEILDAP